MKPLLIIAFVFSFCYSFGQSDSTFIDPEIPAEYPGGTTALMKYIRQNMSFSDQSINKDENSIPGKFYTSFTINETGDVEDVRTLRSSGNAGMDSSLCAVLRKMPRWKPGELNGKPIKQRVNFPINLCPIR